MASNWIMDLETSVYSIVKTRAKSVLSAKYPNINFTMDDATDGTPVFPTVYIHLIPSAEYGSTLDGTEIHAVMATFQVEVYANKEQGLNGARFVTAKVLEEFKKLGFNMTSAPEFVGNTIDKKRMVFRCRRMVGANDTF